MEMKYLLGTFATVKLINSYIHYIYIIIKNGKEHASDKNTCRR